MHELFLIADTIALTLNGVLLWILTLLRPTLESLAWRLIFLGFSMMLAMNILELYLIAISRETNTKIGLAYIALRLCKAFAFFAGFWLLKKDLAPFDAARRAAEAEIKH